MRRLLLVPLALVTLASGAPAQEARPASVPGLRAEPARTGGLPDWASTSPFLLPDVTDLWWDDPSRLTAPSDDATVTLLTLRVDALGRTEMESVARGTTWRGLRLPRDVGFEQPRSEPPAPSPRLKLLATPVGVALAWDGRTCEGWRDLASMIARGAQRDGPPVIESGPSTPMRHVVAAIAVCLDGNVEPHFAAGPADDMATADVRRLLGLLRRAVWGDAPERDERDPAVAIRIRADARAPWSAVASIVDAAARLRISRVGFVANVGNLEVDLARPGARAGRGVVIISRPAPRPQEYDPALKRDLHRTPRIDPEDEPERPIRPLEEDEVEKPKDAPKEGLRNPKLEDPDPVDAFGVGGGAAGPYGDRFAKRGLKARGGDEKTEAAVQRALGWLLRHQSEDGSWRPDGFEKQCGKAGPCSGHDFRAQTGQGPGHGDARYTVGVTGLALLAFLGNGHTHKHAGSAEHREAVRRGLVYLKGVQASDGSIGFSDGEEIYNHAIAAVVLCEAYGMTQDLTLRKPAQKAVEWLLRAQNPGLGWKYGVRPGRNDTSITGWAFLALIAAKDAGIPVPATSIAGALQWFDRATSDKGVVGYERPGDGGSMLNARTLPASRPRYAAMPSMTAVATFCRIRAGRSKDDAILRKGVDLLSGALPVWDAPGSRQENRTNLYYCFFGAQALTAATRADDQRWDAWNRSLQGALVPAQRGEGCTKGSWDPIGDWSIVAGRVGSTALGALSLESYYRIGE